jgi:hypothetical protein
VLAFASRSWCEFAVITDALSQFSVLLVNQNSEVGQESDLQAEVAAVNRERMDPVK